MPKAFQDKEYYSISEVCQLTGLKSHVLRYWESQFKMLNPVKNRAGNRAYRKSDIQIIQLIKHLLYTEMYTIEGAKRKLSQLKQMGKNSAEALPQEEKNREVLLKIRQDINQGVEYGHKSEYFEKQIYDLEAEYKELGMQEFYYRYFRPHLLSNSGKLHYALPEKTEP